MKDVPDVNDDVLEKKFISPWNKIDLRIEFSKKNTTNLIYNTYYILHSINWSSSGSILDIEDIPDSRNQEL